MEFMWYPSFEDKLGNTVTSSTGLFTHNMLRHYNPPCGISVQNYFTKANTQQSYADQISNFKNDPDKLITCLHDSAAVYKTKNLLWMWGDDFSFYYAEDNYKFMDDLIQIAGNQSQDFVFKYSTAKEYYEAVQSEAYQKSITFPIYTEDFMPL